MLTHQGWFTALYTQHLLDSQSLGFEICIFPREAIPSHLHSSKTLSVASWNVNGLFRNVNGVRTCKLDNPQFSSKLCSDIIILNETHASSSDILNLDGYFCVSNCRSTNPSRLRGGVAVLTKDNLRKGVKIIDKSHTDIVWLKLHKSFFLTLNRICIYVEYISPQALQVT